MTVLNQLNTDSVQGAMNFNIQQAHQSDRINRLRNDSTMLCVANTLVNIANIDNNGTPTKHLKQTPEITEPTYEQIIAKPTLRSQQDNILEERNESETPMKFPYKLEISDMSSFPLKLMEALSNEGHKEIISWLAHGRGFMIFQTKEFVEKVMPKYFKQTKFPSFTRKLSRWGFTRVQRGPEVGVYYHDLFLRDNPTFCLKMRSLRGKEGKVKKNIQSKRYQTSPTVLHQYCIGFDENSKRDCTDQVTKMSEDNSPARNNIDERINRNVAQNNLFSASENEPFCAGSRMNSAEEVLRSLLNNSCRQNVSHNIKICTVDQSAIDSLTSLQGLSPVPSIPSTAEFSGGIRNSPLQNMLRTVDTQSNTIPPSLQCPTSPDDPLLKMQVARSILIKSALQRIGRELGVAM